MPIRFGVWTRGTSGDQPPKGWGPGEPRSRPRWRSELARRAVATVAVLAISAVCLRTGSGAFAALAVTVTVAACWELHTLLVGAGYPLPRLLTIGAPPIVVVAAAVAGETGLQVGLGAACLTAGLYAGITRSRGLLLTVLSSAWIAVPMGCAVLLVTSGRGESLLVLSVALIAVFESASYLVGRTWGRRRITPRLSPRKTLEGLAWGSACTFVTAAGWWLAGFGDLTTAVVMGLIVCVLGFAGDLAASALKRAAAVKDSSSLIPGHGGVLDFADGFFFVVPAVYVLHLVHPLGSSGW